MRKRPSGSITCVGIVALAAVTGCRDRAAPLPVEVSPTDGRIRIDGRYDGRDPAGPRIAWPGAGFRFRFRGADLNVILNDSAEGGGHDVAGYDNNYLNVSIDGGAPTVLRLLPGTHTYRVAEDLDEGERTVTLCKRTEGSIGVVQLRGVQLSEAGELLDPPEPLQRRIEFIGDSITAGYGNATSDADAGFAPVTENNAIAYGALTADALDADYVCVAASGIGVHHNWGGSTDDTMPKIYTRTLPQDAAGAWDFSQWTPDVVVVNLGTNDFLYPPRPDKDVFINHLLPLLHTVRENYPEAHVFLAAGPMIGQNNPDHLDRMRDYLQTAIKLLEDSGDDKLHYVEFAPQKDANGYGASSHPSAKTHALMAEQLTAQIRETVGW